MNEKYEEDEEDTIEFVGHYDRFFKNMSDPAVKKEVIDKESLIIQKINEVRQHQLNIKAERDKFAVTNEGITHQALVRSISENSLNKTTRKKEIPEILVSKIARKVFEDTLAKDRPLVDYLRFHSIEELTTKNEHLTLCFIGVRSINLLSPIAFIKEEQWINGVKKSYDLYTKPLMVKPRSRYDAISGLVSKEIIFKKNFHDKKGIYYFLNTVNGEKIYELVEEGKLNRDDLEKLNELFKNKLLHALDLQLIEKFMQYRSAKFADLCSENHHKDQYYLQVEPANFADQKEMQSKSGRELKNSLPIDHPKESPKVTSLNPDLTSVKNIRDFSEGDKIRFLESRLLIWKKNQNDLNYLIENFSLSTVFEKTIDLEEKDRTGLIPKIINFYPYLETSLANNKLKFDSKKSKSSAKPKKQAVKNNELPEKELMQKYLELFRLFNPDITEHVLKCNWYAVLNSFIESFKSKCELKEEIFISEMLLQVKSIISEQEFEDLLLKGGLTNEEMENIFKFIRY